MDNKTSFPFVVMYDIVIEPLVTSDCTHSKCSSFDLKILPSEISNFLVLIISYEKNFTPFQGLEQGKSNCGSLSCSYKGLKPILSKK